MKVVRTLSICAFLLGLVTAGRALDPDRNIRQIAHRSWGEKEGYPGGTQALAQTTDGFLWIGSDIGLFRFDGVHFEQYVTRSGDRLPQISVHSLLALPDGGLWIAYGTAGYENEICLLRHGNVKCYSRTDGVVSTPTFMVRDHEGTIWANTETGVIRFNGTRWEQIGKNWNFPEDVPTETSTALFVDSHGTLWAGVNSTVLYLQQGSRWFEPTGAFAGYSTSIAEAPDGTIWLADSDSYIRAISKSVSLRSAAMARCEALTPPTDTATKCPDNDPLVVRLWAANDLFFDRNGSLWITTDTYGIVRVPHPERLREGPISETSGALQIFNSKDGLSADHCIPVLEDREGNIWVATRDGLDQFRDTALVPVALPRWVVQSAIAPADGGDIWVAGSYSYVGRIRGGSSDISFAPFEAFKPYRDPAGLTWTMGNSLGQWKDGRFQRLAQSPSGVAESFGYWQVAGDRTGTLWAFADDYGFFSWDHDRWKTWATPPEVARQHVAEMFSDSMGHIWVSSYEGNIITMDKGNVVGYLVKSDSPLRFVMAFAEHAPQQIWAGGAGGLALIDRGHIRPIRSAASDDVTGIVDAGNDGLWLSAADGVIHVSKDEVDRALRDPSYRFQGERFDSSDGLPGGTQALSPYPKAVQGTDGRIWFVATRGAAWVNPKESRRRNFVPPPVEIEAITANGKAYDASNELRLAPHVRDLTIDYTALSYVAPEKIRFRYKLEGQDPNWREVVNDREVQYSNLPPGNYRFRVMACNNSGVWNETGASLEFSIAPAYYQTAWFRLLCVAAFAALLWALYQLRLLQIHRQFAVGLEARVGERLRIARELHDTLLQSFQAVAFQLQAARKLQLRKADNAGDALEEAIQATGEAIQEGRSAIRDLRPEPAAQRDLPELLNAVGRELSTAQEVNGNAPSYRVVLEGKQQDLSPILQDEVFRIAREVIRNAFAHAAASLVEVEIRYDQDQLRLRVRDDGKGIDPKVLAGGQSGHFGIPGMRERAQRIGARLDFWSEMGAGTEVELTVPASMAYQKRRDGSRFRLFNWAGNDEQRS
jgi:signal transduction histidine kinase/ligand-binding sensor domain-containing protein